MGVALLKRDIMDGSKFVEHKDLQIGRDIELETVLEPGSYLVVPRTSGCNIKRPAEAAEPEGVRLQDDKGNLSLMFESTLTDIFKKFDLVITNSLDFKEFNDFLNVLGKAKLASDVEFKNQVLSKFNSNEKAITLKGFKQWWRQELDNTSAETVFAHLAKLGYDKDLYSLRSRRFNITFHSKSLEGSKALEVRVRDAIGTDIDRSVSQMILKEFGKDLKKGDSYRIVEHFSE